MTPQEQEPQKILDRAAYFNLITTADPRQRSVPRYVSSRLLTGVDVHGIGRRFDVTMRMSSRGELRARNVVGEPAVWFRFKWLLIPDDYVVVQGQMPPPTALDTSRTQRFAVEDAEFEFGPDRENRFRGIGAGRTFPLERGDRSAVRLAAVCSVLDGQGQFAGLDGIYVLSGLFRPPADFRLNVLIRLNDVSGNLLASRPLPPPRPESNPVHASTFMTFHTFADPAEFQLLSKPPPVASFEAQEYLTLAHVDFAMGPDGPRSESQIGPSAGRHTVQLSLFPGNYQATALTPYPFYDKEGFYFVDQEGRPTGSLQADVVEGRAFQTPVAGIPQQMQPQLAAGFASISDAQGQFAGCQGMVTNVSIGTLYPRHTADHLTSIIYLFEIFDRTGRFRSH